MYKGNRILAVIPVFNEKNKIGKVIKEIPYDLIDLALVIDDGSNDGSDLEAESFGAKVIRLGSTLGVGAALRRGFEFAIENNYEIIVIIAGNGKDNPKQTIRLIRPIVDERFDFIQGSRYLTGGGHANTPYYRLVATRLHAFLFSLASGKLVTESSNGFRAFRTQILKDSRINLWQEWLNQYELEIYLYYKTIRCGYRTKEAPVTKVYPGKGVVYTKMKPVTGWWSMLKVLILLPLRIRR